MTGPSSFERLVSARVGKTGESRATARERLLAAERPRPSEGPALAVADAVIRERTGRGWEEWFAQLDAWGAAQWSNRQIRERLATEHGIEGWNQAAVAVTFERARDLRAVGERADGFAITASRTIGAPVERVFDAVVDPGRREGWLPGVALPERRATRPRSARFDWVDGRSRVAVSLTPKGTERCTVSLVHERLADGETAECMQAFWRERLAALASALAG